MSISISKFDAAKRELEYAIRLFFNYGDVLIIHLISSAAQTILSDIGKASGITSIKEQINKHVKKEKRKYVQDKLNEAYNFLKHGSKDTKKLLEFNPESNEFVI